MLLEKSLELLVGGKSKGTSYPSPKKRKKGKKLMKHKVRNQTLVPRDKVAIRV